MVWLIWFKALSLFPNSFLSVSVFISNSEVYLLFLSRSYVSDSFTMTVPAEEFASVINACPLTSRAGFIGRYDINGLIAIADRAV